MCRIFGVILAIAFIYQIAIILIYPLSQFDFGDIHKGGNDAWANAWSPSIPLNASLFLVKSPTNTTHRTFHTTAPLWTTDSFPYRKMSPVANSTLVIPLPDDLSRDMTYFLRLKVCRAGCSDCVARELDLPLFHWTNGSEVAEPYAFHFNTIRFDLVYVDRKFNRNGVNEEVAATVLWDHDRRIFWPPLTGDPFVEMRAKRLALNRSAPNVTIGFEFNVRGFSLWLWKLGWVRWYNSVAVADSPFPSWVIESWDVV
jgi:hypothetical protein